MMKDLGVDGFGVAGLDGFYSKDEEVEAEEGVFVGVFWGLRTVVLVKSGSI